MKRLALATVAACVFTGVAAADHHYRPPESTVGNSQFLISVGFWNLPPGARYYVTFVAHFEPAGGYEGTYDLGMNTGRTVDRWGRFIASTDVADLVYFNRGEPLEWVRVCLHPPYPNHRQDITGPDGQPLCVNVETGGYHTDDY